MNNPNTGITLHQMMKLPFSVETRNKYLCEIPAVLLKLGAVKNGT